MCARRHTIYNQLAFRALGDQARRRALPAMRSPDAETSSFTSDLGVESFAGRCEISSLWSHEGMNSPLLVSQEIVLRNFEAAPL